MMLIQTQNDWEIVKVNGRFAAISLDENQMLLGHLREYGSYENVPDSEKFTAFELVKNESGHYFCNGQTQENLKVNEIEFFLLPIIQGSN